MDENGIKHEFTDKLPLSNFPLKPSDDKDAPIVIYEFPIENAPYGLYVAGVDPYRQVNLNIVHLLDQCISIKECITL